MKGAKSPLRVQSSSFLNFLSSENWTAAGRKDFFDTLKKPPQPELGRLFYDRACKPGSVLTVIYLGVPLPIRSSHLPETAGPAICLLYGVAPDRVYSDGHSHEPSGALLPHLSTLTGGRSAVRRYLSVALFLRSLWAGVTRYPCPVEPGLSSQHGLSALRRATVRPGRANIVTDDGGFVKPDCIFFFQRL